MASGEQTATSFYEAVGGAATFRRIVAAFYREVARDEVLRPLYPEEDLGPAERRLRMFLEQYWGGPRTYSDERGHPRLRMRHMSPACSRRRRGVTQAAEQAGAWMRYSASKALARRDLSMPALPSTTRRRSAGGRSSARNLSATATASSLIAQCG